ncbi:hypothetical protein K4K54_004853 [Colletotrichum sp. SAR 10_86]|nr:hypothetical protein KHU50_009486 [Colletotrichum sp. SAR 10_65]KAI8225078.1 hypothetical protein K4K54_004853 [Colletotrichum sp. SAR 10_86]
MQLVVALSLLLTVSLAIPKALSSPSRSTNDESSPDVLFAKRDEEEISLNFVKRWAAIGDSFTAGIGSGSRMGKPIQDTRAWYCSRYTYTWPHLVNRYIGGGVSDFQYPACSGARTGDIYNQARDLEGNLDVVMLTAGGNDLCLASMIKTCVMLPYEGMAACTSLIEKAQENIDTILKDNIRDVLNELKPKVKSGGIVVFSGYAPFFNTESEDCGDPKKQDWAMKAYLSWGYWTTTSLKLTVDLRKKFNKLVANINKAIEEVVEEFQKDRDVKYDIEFSDWSGWPAEIDGQMCSTSSDGTYPDKNQPNMLFFKPSTRARDSIEHDALRKRRGASSLDPDAHEAFVDADGGLEDGYTINETVTSEIKPSDAVADLDIYDTLFYKSPNAAAVAKKLLDRRAPTPPGCPNDDSLNPTQHIGVPDYMGRYFHPNQKGHEAIAAFALFNLGFAKAKQQGKTADQCSVDLDEFTCWRKSKNSKKYASWAQIDKNYRKYCAEVRAPSGTMNWEDKRTFHPGTPDEHEFRIKLSDGATRHDEGECREAMDRILNGCDGGDDNPMNWKFGGEWKRGSYTFQINPKRERAFYTRPEGRCRGEYQVGASWYQIYGRGWASHDWGQTTLLQAAKDCDTAPTGWTFDYYDDPDKDNMGYEWKASFRTVVWSSNRCFNNLWVQAAAGGHTHKWKPNAKGEKYEDFGCSGGGWV